MAEADRPADGVYDESMWSDENRPEGMHPYLKSKLLAERTAWDFQKALPEDQKFEIVTINPGFVMGPPLRKESFTSGGFTKRLMEGGMAEISADHFAAVDVRDVAQAHLLGIKNPKAANKRFLLVNANFTYQEYAAPIIAKYRPLGWPITEKMGAPNPDEYVQKYNNHASK